MARSPNKAASESVVTPAGEDTLEFDDDTLRGEKKHVFFSKDCKEPPQCVFSPGWPAVHAYIGKRVLNIILLLKKARPVAKTMFFNYCIAFKENKLLSTISRFLFILL